jgi:AcrR family transcriptional regulator
VAATGPSSVLICASIRSSRSVSVSVRCSRRSQPSFVNATDQLPALSTVGQQRTVRLLSTIGQELRYTRRMSQRAYRRLQSDERRALLLERAVDLFAIHGYEGLSMSQLAREANISKALLYHYFPSKRRLFEDVLAEGAHELRDRTEPDPSKPAAEQLAATLDAFLAWVQERPAAYAKLLESAGSSEVRGIVDEVRATTAARILHGLGDDGERPATRAAVSGWLGFLDGAILDWIAHGCDLSRQELHGMLLGTFAGALVAAGAGAALAS